MIRNFWDKNAHIYNHFMKKDARAYEKMCELMRPVVKGKTVLDLATGTGLIAGNLVGDAGMIEATDASPAMIAEAKSNYRSAKLHFSVQDMFCMPYVDNTFDVVIVANALHIVKRTGTRSFRNPPGAEKRRDPDRSDFYAQRQPDCR